MFYTSTSNKYRKGTDKKQNKRQLLHFVGIQTDCQFAYSKTKPKK